jgi:hypothetical protein
MLINQHQPIANDKSSKSNELAPEPADLTNNLLQVLALT